MGKIIFSSVHPELIEKINSFCRQKSIPAEIFEDLSAGLNHSEIGAMIAKKWNFPTALIMAIKYHHNPLQAPRHYREVVFTVYLANALCHFHESQLEYDQLEPRVLEAFRITSEEQLNRIDERLDNAFAREAVG
jgi:HD-like signal output (HDOD) protein